MWGEAISTGCYVIISVMEIGKRHLTHEYPARVIKSLETYFAHVMPGKREVLDDITQLKERELNLHDAKTRAADTNDTLAHGILRQSEELYYSQSQRIKAKCKRSVRYDAMQLTANTIIEGLHNAYAAAGEENPLEKTLTELKRING